MTLRSRSTLKGYFNTGDKPTETQFSDFIESIPNYADYDPGTWMKKTILYSDVSAASTTKTLQIIASIPAKCIVKDLGCNIKTYFTGGAISNVNIRPQTNSSTMFGNLSVFASTSKNCFSQMNSYAVAYVNGNFSSVWTFNLLFISVSANLDQLTAGELDFYYRLQQLT